MKHLPTSLVIVGVALMQTLMAEVPIPAVNDTLFSTWLEDPHTTMTVQWVAPTKKYRDLKTDGFQEIPEYTDRSIPSVETAAAFFAAKGTEGLFIPVMHRDPALESDDANLRLSLGHTDEELLMWMHVTDDEHIELENLKRLHRADSVSVYVIDAKKPKNGVQLMIGSGKDPKQGEVRIRKIDRRSKRRQHEIVAEVERVDLSETEYQLHVRVAWSSLGWEGPRNSVRLQVNLIDLDEGDIKTQRLLLYPKSRTHREPLHSLELSCSGESSGSLPVQVSFAGDQGRVLARFEKDREDSASYRVVFPAGEPIPLTFKEEGGRHRVELEIPFPEQNSFKELALLSGDQPLGTVDIPLKHRIVPTEEKEVTLIDHAGDVVQTKPITHHPFDPAGTYRVYRVHFDGLEPDSFYRFKLKKWGQKYVIRTAPETMGEGLVFAEGGDVGTDEKNVAALHDVAASWDPLFGFVGGDLAYGDGVNLKPWLAYLALWSEHMRGTEGNLIPMLVTVGNHEVEGSYGDDPSKAPFFYSLFGGEPGMFHDGAYGTYDFGNYLRIIALDSGHTMNVADQTAWLKQTLNESERFAFTFPAYHFPAYPSHRKAEGRIPREIRQHWTPLFDAHNIGVVFEHHDHTYKRSHPLVAGNVQGGGTVYLGDGAWGRKPRTGLEERPYLEFAKGCLNVIKVTLKPDEAHFKAFDEKGDVIDMMTLKR